MSVSGCCGRGGRRRRAVTRSLPGRRPASRQSRRRPHSPTVPSTHSPPLSAPRFVSLHRACDPTRAARAPSRLVSGPLDRPGSVTSRHSVIVRHSVTSRHSVTARHSVTRSVCVSSRQVTAVVSAIPCGVGLQVTCCYAEFALGPETRRHCHKVSPGIQPGGGPRLNLASAQTQTLVSD